MESVFKKFEGNAIDMAKVFGGAEYYTGERSWATEGGAIYEGEEWVREDAEGCLWMYLVPYNGTGILHDNVPVC